MASFLFVVLSIASLFPTILAKTHTITVGHYAFTFTPSSISSVAVGDFVEFQFPGEQYSVVRAAYSSPCRRGVDTGSTSGGEDQAVWSGGVGGLTDDNTWTILINSTEPFWFYECNRCKQAMVGVINPPATGGTLEEWRDKHLTTASGYGDPVPQEERCPDGEKGGRLGKKASGQLVDPESASATAPARDGEAQPTGVGAGGGSGDAGTGNGNSGSEAASVTGSGWVAGFVGLVGVLAF